MKKPQKKRIIKKIRFVITGFCILSFFIYIFMIIYLKVSASMVETTNIEIGDISVKVEKEGIFLKNIVYLSGIYPEDETTVKKGERIKSGSSISKYDLKDISTISGVLDDYKVQKYLVSDIGNISADQIKNEKPSIKKEEDISGEVKTGIRDNHEFYFLTEISYDDVKNMKRNIAYKVNKDGNTFFIKFEDFYKDKNEKYIGIFRSEDDFRELRNYNVESISIEMKDIEGLKISKTALIDKEDKKGVLTIDKVGKIRFKEVDVLFEDQLFILVSKNPNLQDVDSPILVNELIIVNPKILNERENNILYY